MRFRLTSARLTTILLALFLIACTAMTFASRGVDARLISRVSPSAPFFVDQSFVRKIDLATNDLVVDPNTQTLYASVPSSAGAIGNKIVPINPNTGDLGAGVFVGSEPNKMAISDNGQFIYVGLQGAGAVRRFDSTTQTADIQFSLGTDSFNGPNFPGELAVQPGNPGTVAVAAQSGLVSIYDNGVRRPNGIGTGSNSLVFNTANNSRLYALSSGLLTRLSVTASGVSSINSSNVSASGAAKLSEGRLYTSSGQVLDPENGNLFGTFTGLGTTTTAFTPDETVHRVYFLSAPFSSGGPVTVTLRAYDSQTFVPVGTLDIPNILGTPTEMVRWGSNGLAFCTTGGNVVLIQTTLIPSGGPIPTPTPTPTTPSPTPTPTPVPTPGVGELRQIALATNDLAVGPTSATIFASVPSSGGANGNSITPINATAGTLEQSVFVGSEPNKLAISDNGSTIYVALDGANAVRKFDTGSRAPGLQFSLGGDQFFGPYRAEDISVAPGQPNVIAVSRLRPGVSPRHGGVAIFDNGVQRTLTTPDHTGSNVIEFSNSPEILYGQNTETTEFGFRRMAVATCGVITLNTSQNLIAGFGLDFRVDNGLVFATGGRLIDPETRTLLGTFIVRNPNSFGSGPILVAPDVKAGRVYFVLDEAGVTFLRVFDTKTFLKIGELQLPGVSGTISSLIRWGQNGLAFRSAGQVYLLQNALIGVPDPTFVPSPQPPSPTASTNVQVSSFNGDAGGVSIGVTGSLTTTTTTNSSGNATITGIPPCGSFTVTPSKPNYVFNPSSTTVTNPTQMPSISFTATLKTVGFIQSTTSLGEGTNKLFVSVQRSITADPTSVFYETVPGTASDRSDFNPTFGRLDFAQNESSKTIPILLTDDTLVEGAEQFTVVLKNATGAELVPAQSTLTVTITDNDSTPNAPNPLTNAQFFVRQQYQDFLNRAASDDPTGFNFWTNEITACNAETDPVKKGDCLGIKRVNVSAAFFLSIEFQQTGYLVHRFYTSSFPPSAARPRGLPRFAEFLNDTQTIGRGVVVGAFGWEQQLEQNKQAFATDWVGRSEFLLEHPTTQTADQYVDSLFANNGVTPTPAERAAAITAFSGGGTAGRAAALRNVADSQSVLNKQSNPAFVLMQYFGYLRRNPDDAPDGNFDGYQFWLDKLNQFNGNFVQADMVKAFLVSQEYQQRFGASNFVLNQ